MSNSDNDAIESITPSSRLIPMFRRGDTMFFQSDSGIVWFEVVDGLIRAFRAPESPDCAPELLNLEDYDVEPIANPGNALEERINGWIETRRQIRLCMGDLDELRGRCRVISGRFEWLKNTDKDFNASFVVAYAEERGKIHEKEFIFNVPQNPWMKVQFNNSIKEAAVAVLDAFKHCRETPTIDPDHGDAVKELGERIGYGALMSTAEALWCQHLSGWKGHAGGEHINGPCRATFDRAMTELEDALKISTERE